MRIDNKVEIIIVEPLDSLYFFQWVGRFNRVLIQPLFTVKLFQRNSVPTNTDDTDIGGPVRKRSPREKSPFVAMIIYHNLKPATKKNSLIN